MDKDFNFLYEMNGPCHVLQEKIPQWWRQRWQHHWKISVYVSLDCNVSNGAERFSVHVENLLDSETIFRYDDDFLGSMFVAHIHIWQ